MTHQTLAYPLLWTILTASSLAMEGNANANFPGEKSNDKPIRHSRSDLGCNPSDSTLRMLEESDNDSDDFIDGVQNISCYDLPATRILSRGDWTGDAPIDLEKICYKYFLSESQLRQDPPIHVEAHLVWEPILFGHDFPGSDMLSPGKPPSEWTVPGLPDRVRILIQVSSSYLLTLPLGDSMKKDAAGLTQEEIDTFKILKEGAPQSPYEQNFTIDNKALKKLKTLPFHQGCNLIFGRDDEDMIEKYADGLDTFFPPAMLKQVIRLHYYGAPRSQIGSILEIPKSSINKMFNVWHLLQKFREERRVQGEKLLEESLRSYPSIF